MRARSSGVSCAPGFPESRLEKSRFQFNSKPFSKTSPGKRKTALGRGTLWVGSGFPTRALGLRQENRQADFSIVDGAVTLGVVHGGHFHPARSQFGIGNPHHPVTAVGDGRHEATLAFGDGVQRHPGAPPKPPTPHAADEALLPENGHLSNTTYTSDYFGFAFDLPIAAQGHLLMLPLMPERQNALLALQFENASHAGTINITAIEPRSGLEALTPEQQQQEFDNWASSGSLPGRALRYPIPDYMLRTTGRFYSSVRHKGENYAAFYSTRIKNYNLRIQVDSNDQDFLRKSKRAINAAHFYCTQDDGTLTTADGKPVKPEGDPYTGPTVPTALAYEAVKAKPALEGIPLGGVSGAMYRNPDLGLQYQFPKGWDVFPAEANDDPPHDAIALREHEFLHACSKTLLRIAQPGPSGAADQLGRPTITLRALDPSCLVMRIPSSLTDKNAMDNVLASLEVLSEFGEIGSDELVSISDHLFMVFHGTIASHASNDELSQRWSQVIYATLHHKVLFVWSLAAPNSADLNAMPTTGITLDGAQSIDLRASLTAKR